jgi:DnaJ-class molecular chaperone
MSDDPYADLGVSKDATEAEIKKAYRKIARDSHPDLNPEDKGAEARFKAASAAYDLLRDPEKRARFDRGEIDASGQERPPRQYYREYAEGPGNPYRGGFGQGQEFEGFEGFDASDIFADFLRQRGAGRARQGGQQFSVRGQDMRYQLELPFLDAAMGAKRRITLPDGAALEVTIPEGTADGQTIRLRGKGGPGFGGGEPGDALVTISVAPHPLFTREGDDILVTLPITIDEAVLGGKVATPTISGPVNLTIPKGATTGQVLRLRGRGVKGRGKAPRGDQRVELRITMPKEVDDELADFMRGWAERHGYDPRKGMK